MKAVAEMQNAERIRKNWSQANRQSKSRPFGLLRLFLPFLFLLTMLTPLKSNAADLAIKNGNFSNADGAVTFTPSLNYNGSAALSGRPFRGRLLPQG
jgi:hypothetical protein